MRLQSSWTKIGVPSAFAIGECRAAASLFPEADVFWSTLSSPLAEATFEDSNTRNIHTGSDTINVPGFSFDHMAQFVKLAMAFVLELSE